MSDAVRWANEIKVANMIDHLVDKMFTDEAAKAEAEIRQLLWDNKIGFVRLAQSQHSNFNGFIALGFDKNGSIDFRINMSIADLSRPQMDELCRMMPWTIKEALGLWLDHGPPSKEMGAAQNVVTSEKHSGD